jgi:zinc protease
MLSKFFDFIIPLFWEMLTKPGFRAKELSRIKKEVCTGLQAELADPMSIANRHFGVVLCGKKHPVGRSQTIRSIKKNNLGHLRKFYDSFISPEKGILVIAGDFQADEVVKKWRALFASWNKRRTNDYSTAGALPPLTANTIRLVDKPDLSQVSLIIGHPACSELDPARNELALANYILGGGNFSSRLMEHIRSREGKTYGISSHLSSCKNYGIFSIATSTQNSQASSMLKSIMEVYRTFAEKGVSGEELDKAKKYAIGNMAFQLEGIVNVAEKLLWLWEYGRDISYIERFNDRISGVTVESVNAAIKNYLSSSYFAITAVGKKEDVLNTLAGYGSVQTVNFRDNP